jgi:CRISPR/Cas system-associated protein Cas10 (large subunit of type III CRISPR-Cas system)
VIILYFNKGVQNRSSKLLNSAKGKRDKGRPRIERPSVLGIGLGCTFRSSGISIAPNFTPIFCANGVSSRDIKRAMENVRRMVVIVFWDLWDADLL